MEMGVYEELLKENKAHVVQLILFYFILTLNFEFMFNFTYLI